ncbi:MAG: PQQ-dependent sugar dehydrogenase, partial [Bacteroidota bacterium]
EQKIPEVNRFHFEDLVSNLNEPMELDFLPNGDILFIERRGILKHYEQATKRVQVVGEIPVNYINENGLLGMALDPKFEKNSWIYFFYTDPVRKSYQQISRFDFKENQLINKSEKKLLDFYIDYDHCCHFGGSIAFGPDGNLFISSGDNVGGKDFAPIDERPGRSLHDSQRSSGNSNDLRGAILRIKPENDGSYSIPEGNLFPPNTPKTRPEIYVMGARNPLKIDVDQETGWLYWGDVGPNPGWKYKEWGPPSYEEVNQAKKAGNYGWPYMMGDNQAFRDVDFANMQASDFFDPQTLINNSPNNTGIQALPPAQKALIWYPNTASDSFPLVGTGGGTICAGPVYHFDKKLESTEKWPSYFDKKLFIFEWMRSWVLAVELDDSGAYQAMENPFKGKPFKKPIDIGFGPEGAMYVLDYGSNWYAQNPDARLTKISYVNGNRPPKAEITSSSLEGAAPLKINFSARTSFDPDENDQLSYNWLFEGEVIQSEKAEVSHTFTRPGTYKVSLLVSDESGLRDTAVQHIRVGNDPPKVQLSIAGNQSFFLPNQAILYEVRVRDTEDGNSEDASIAAEKIHVHVKHLKHSTNLKAIRETESVAASTTSFLQGKQLMDGSDCYACHALDKQSVGPSFLDISKKYGQEDKVRLTTKVLEGGSGIWGEKLMPAHPQHNDREANAMISYILALTMEAKKGQRIGLEGSISTKSGENTDLFILTAAYTDQGANEQPAIHKEIRKIFRPNLIPAVAFDDAKRIKAKAYNEAGDLYAEVALNGCYIGFEEIDLGGVKAIRAKIRSTSDWVEVELRQSSPEGKLLDKKRKELGFKENKWAPYKEEDWFYIDLNIPSNAGMDDLYFVFNSSKETSEYIYYDICQVHSFEFLF